MSDLRKLLQLFRPYRLAAAGGVMAMVGAAVFTTLVGYLLGPVVDQVVSRNNRGAFEEAVSSNPLAGTLAMKRTAPVRVLDRRLKAIVDSATDPKTRARVLPFLLFLAFLARNLCTFVAEYRFNAVGLSFVASLRERLYARLLAQSGAFHAAHPSGDLVSRVTGDVDRIQSLFGTDLADLVQSIATLLGLAALVVSLSPELTGMALVVAPAIVVPVVLIAKRLRSISRAGRQRMGDLTAVLSETLRGHRVVQAYGAEGYERNRFGDVNERTLRLLKRSAWVMAFSSPLVETASVLTFLVLLAFAANRIAAGTMSFGTFVSFGAGLVMMYQPFKRATRINLALQNALASARRVFEVLEPPIDVRDWPTARELPAFRHSIALENVSFAYPGRTPALSNVSLTVPRGSVTAIVGPSGAGKSTLVGLLPRFMDVTEGRVLVDGIDVRDVTLASLRNLFGLVTQDVVLFDDTVRHNVSYGRELAEEDIQRALRSANAAEFVDALPGGLDARVGEGGTRLSGGQRQRLAIARAILKDPPILLLDEATSALDSESERIVQEALERLMRGRTSIVIAHRLSTVRRADRIVVLDKGRVLEEGDHEVLLARGGLYRRLHDTHEFAREASASDAEESREQGAALLSADRRSSS